MPNRKGYIDYDELAKAIAKSKEIEEENAIALEKEKLQNKFKEIGYKEYKCRVLNFFNKLWVCIKILCKPQKYMNEYMGISMLMALVLSFIFKLIEYGLYGLSVMFVCIAITQSMYWVIACCFFSVIFARLFRMASIEMENSSSEKSYIVSVFSSTIAIIALVISIIVNFKRG